MAYEKQNFTPGQILTAAQANHIEAGIAAVDAGKLDAAFVDTTGTQRDIYVDLNGIMRGGAEYAVANSDKLEALLKSRSNGFTVRFGSGHYYFARPIVRKEYTVFSGACSNACTYSNPSVGSDANHGTYLHFPNLANGEAAISIEFGGVVENLEIVGNPAVCDVSLDRSKTVTAPDSIVSLTDAGTTYGIKIDGNSPTHTISGVKVRNCTYGIYSDTANALITNVDVERCKVGVSVGNDVKVNNVQAWNVMVGVELRGQLASVSNLRGDSIGQHLVVCKKGKCLLVNIDGDYCLGSLIHYGGDNDAKYIHLGRATACMGRVAIKQAYARGAGFDLRNVPASDYEYCSYVSIAPDTYVFGGQIDVVNVNANPMDTSSAYVHPDAVLSIGSGSTVKGLTVKCSMPDGVDAEYLSKRVVKNLSSYAVASNDTTNYVTDFDGQVIEDIGFSLPTAYFRSCRTVTNADRHIVYVEARDSSKLETSALPEAINTALAQAKASGEFDGKDGKDGPAGNTPVKGVDFWTLADQESIVQDVIAALGMPVFGQVDADNNIILTGALTDGVYTLKYEDADGAQSVIGSLTVGSGEPEQTYTNLFDPAAVTLNKRMSGSNSAEKAADGYVMTAVIELPETVTSRNTYDDSTPFMLVPAAMWSGSANMFTWVGGFLSGYCDANATPGTRVGDWMKVPIYNQWADDGGAIHGVKISLHVKDSAITATDIQNIKIYFNEIPE